MTHVFPIEQFTARQQKFILEYCKTQHSTHSAIAAGANPKTASSVGAKWLANPRIRTEIERRLAARLDRYDVAPEKIIREMALLAFSSLDDFIAFTEQNHAVVDFEGVTRDQMAALSEIVTEEFTLGRGVNAPRGVRTKIKLADKRAALMDLARLINMLQPEKVMHGGTIEHQHKHAHVVINPRDMSPRQRELLKTALLAIDSNDDDEGEKADGASDHETR